MLVFRKVFNFSFLLCIIPLNYAKLYQFFFDNEHLFDKCSHIEGSNGIYDMVDITELNLEFSEGNINCSGNVTIIWDVQPEDRIEFHGEIFKYGRGSWQPTVYNVLSKDFCEAQYDKNLYWYQLWAKNIPTEEQICVNHKGLTYHHTPFSINSVFDVPVNAEGRHKIEITFTAYENGIVERPNSICFQIVGELIKV
ncbi:uncharacterized protein [Musca autumnalis]|uniref:uncharacterized protein n=1 Tax=Musca autumnalis TaxID=221902 RepID=UPI003CEE777D